VTLQILICIILIRADGPGPHATRKKFDQMAVLLLAALAHSEVRNYVSTESARLYVFACGDDLRLRYLPVSSLDLVIRATRQEISCTGVQLCQRGADRNITIDLDLEMISDHLYQGLVTGVPTDTGPYDLVFSCTAGQSGNVTIAPISIQHIISRSGLVGMGVAGLLLIVAVLTIIGIQFCTFHHKKHD
jgi:hypothetical protein